MNRGAVPVNLQERNVEIVNILNDIIWVHDDVIMLKIKI